MPDRATSPERFGCCDAAVQAGRVIWAPLQIKCQGRLKARAPWKTTAGRYRGGRRQQTTIPTVTQGVQTSTEWTHATATAENVEEYVPHPVSRREREVTYVPTPIQQLPMADFLRILAMTRRQRTISRPISPIDGETFEDVEEEACVYAITY